MQEEAVSKAAAAAGALQSNLFQRKKRWQRITGAVGCSQILFEKLWERGGCPTGPLCDPSPNQPPATLCVPAHVMAVHGWLDRVYCFLAYFKYSWNLPHPLANWGRLTSKPHNLSIS